jgi:hypothetical protein
MASVDRRGWGWVQPNGWWGCLPALAVVGDGRHAALLRRCGGRGRLLRERLGTPQGELLEEHHGGGPQKGHVERRTNDVQPLAVSVMSLAMPATVALTRSAVPTMAASHRACAAPSAHVTTGTSRIWLADDHASGERSSAARPWARIRRGDVCTDRRDDGGRDDGRSGLTAERWGRRKAWGPGSEPRPEGPTRGPAHPPLRARAGKPHLGSIPGPPGARAELKRLVSVRPRLFSGSHLGEAERLGRLEGHMRLA